MSKQTLPLEVGIESSDVHTTGAEPRELDDLLLGLVGGGEGQVAL